MIWSFTSFQNNIHKRSFINMYMVHTLSTFKGDNCSQTWEIIRLTYNTILFTILHLVSAKCVFIVCQLLILKYASCVIVVATIHKQCHAVCLYCPSFYTNYIVNIFWGVGGKRNNFLGRILCHNRISNLTAARYRVADPLDFYNNKKNNLIDSPVPHRH